MAISRRIALLVVTTLVAGRGLTHALLAHAQGERDALSKAPTDVVDRARQGIAQDLFVILDDKSIAAREADKRKSRGLQYNDAQLNEETARELQELRASVFPGGKLGGATVLSEQKHAPILLVRVPDLIALAKVLSHPMVIGVERNDQFRPT